VSPSQSRQPSESGQVLSTSLVASAGAWGETFQAREPFSSTATAATRC
jgi:hypothetical protein